MLLVGGAALTGTVAAGISGIEILEPYQIGVLDSFGGRTGRVVENIGVFAAAVFA